MEAVRKPCEHRGSDEVVVSPMPTPQGSVDFCICKECRRFWLERNGWLLSRRETMSILRDWPLPATTLHAAR
jgi:hypothetical protein